MSRPLSPAAAPDVASYEEAVIRRVEHLTADGGDALTRRALRLLTKRHRLMTASERDVVEAVKLARAGEELEGAILSRNVAEVVAAHARADLAAAVARTSRGLNEDEHAAALDGAIVALELVDRDRPLVEAALARLTVSRTGHP